MSDDIKEQFWKALATSPILMVRRDGSGEHAQPMYARLDKDRGPQYGGAVWFFTHRDNRLAAGGPAMAQYVSTGHDLFACVSGRLVEETDEAQIDRLWNNPVAAWFEGREDPTLLVLRMELDEIEIWNTDMSLMGKLKMILGSRIKPGEAGEHAELKI